MTLLLKTPHISAADKLLVLRREIELELEGDCLEPWQRDFCHWLSLHPRSRYPDQLDAASALASTSVTLDELKRMKARKPWREMWFKLRGAYEDEINSAKEKYAKMAVKAATIHDEMLDIVRKDKDTRAAPPLLIPLLERAWPKQSDGPTVATQINITLSPAQQLGLESPAFEVTAEEVKVLPP